MFKVYGVRINDNRPLIKVSDYECIYDMSVDVFLISPFFPKALFGIKNTLFEEMYVYSYGRDTYTINSLKWKCVSPDCFHEFSDLKLEKGIFHAKTILMKREDRYWIVVTTSNMQHSCYDGVYNIYMRREIRDYEYKKVIDSYSRLPTCMVDVNDSDMIKFRPGNIYTGSVGKKWKLHVGRRLLSRLFTYEHKVRDNSVIVCANETNFKYADKMNDKVDVIYYSISDIAKVYNEDYAYMYEIPRIKHYCKNHIKMYITDKAVYFGSVNFSKSSEDNIECLCEIKGECVRICAESWIRDLVIYVPPEPVSHDDSREVLPDDPGLQGDRTREQKVQRDPRQVPLQPSSDL